jgi:hypothetical protein
MFHLDNQIGGVQTIKLVQVYFGKSMPHNCVDYLEILALSDTLFHWMSHFFLVALIDLATIIFL